MMATPSSSNEVEASNSNNSKRSKGFSPGRSANTEVRSCFTETTSAT